jgi:hypothetical protein
MKIKAPDGRDVEFPDGMPMDQVEAAMREAFPPTQGAQAQPFSEMEKLVMGQSGQQPFLATAGKAPLVGAANLLSGLVGGLPAYGLGSHEALDPVAETIRNMVSPKWQQDVGEAASNPDIFNPTKQAAAIGQVLPVSLLAGASAKGGAMLGGQLGGMAGPVGRMIGTGVGAVGGAILPFILTGADNFTQSVKPLPFDADLVERESRNYGVTSAGAGAVANVPATMPYMRVGKTIAAPFAREALEAAGEAVSTGLSRKLLKRAGQEATAVGAAGLGGSMDAMLFNSHLDHMVEIQNKRNRERGLPPMDPKAVEELKRSAAQSFLDFGSLTAIMRAPHAVGSMTGTTMEHLRSPSQRAQAAAALERGEVVKPPTLAQNVPFGKPEYDALIQKPISKELQMQKFQDVIEKVMQDSHNVPRAVFDIAQNLGVDTMRPGTKIPTDVNTVVQRIKAKLQGPIREGIQIDPVTGKVEERAVQINTVSKVETMRGDLLDKILRATVGEAQKEIVATPKGPLERLNDPASQIKRTALAKSGMGDEIAEHLTRTTSPSEKSLRTVLTNYDYARYLDTMEGLINQKRDEQNALHAQQDPKYLGEFHKIWSSIPLENGIGLKLESLPPSKALSPLMMTWGRMLDVMQHIDAQYPRLQMLPIFNELMKGVNYAHDLQRFSGAAMEHWLRQLPGDLRGNSKIARVFNAGVDWLSQDGGQREKIEAVFELPKVPPKGVTMEQLWVKKIREAGAKSSETEIKKWLHYLGGREIEGAPMSKQPKKVVLYRWWKKNGIVSPEQARAIYSPILRKYNKDEPGGNRVGLDQWLWKHKADQALHRHLVELAQWNDYNKPPESIKDLFDLMLSRRNIEDVTIPKPGKKPSMMEMERTADPREEASIIRQLLKESDDARLRDLDYITEPAEEAFYYSKHASRRLAFRRIVPVLERVYDQIMTEITNPNDREYVLKNFRNLLEEVAGIPDIGTRAWSAKTIPSNATAVVQYFTRGQVSLNELPLFKKFFKEATHTSLNRTINGISTGLYAYALGIPNNWKSPIMNLVSQGPMVIPMLGIQTYIKGLHRFIHDPAFAKRLEDRNIRPQTYIMDRYEMSHFNKFTRGAQYMMAAFSQTDWLNVMGAAAGAEVAWERLGALLKGDPKATHLTDNQIMDVLVRNRKIMVDTDKVFTAETANAKTWSGAVNKNLMREIIRLVRSGQSEIAQDMWVRYAADFSQWHYGPGGTGMNWRGPVAKLMGMYMSWPASYIPYIGRVVGGGVDQMMHDFSIRGTTLPFRTMQMLATQLTLIGMLKGLGMPLKGGKYIGLGPLPQSALPAGQAVEGLNLLMQYLNAKNEQGVNFLLDDEEEMEKARQQAERAVQSFGRQFSPGLARNYEGMF